MGAEKWDKHYVGSEYLGKLNGISYTFASNAFSCSPFSKCLVPGTHTSGEEIFSFLSDKFSLILGKQAWRTPFLCCLTQSPPLSFLKNNGWPLVYVSTINHYALSDRNDAFHLLVPMLKISNVQNLDVALLSLWHPGPCAICIFIWSKQICHWEQDRVVLRHACDEFLPN